MVMTHKDRPVNPPARTDAIGFIDQEVQIDRAAARPQSWPQQGGDRRVTQDRAIGTGGVLKSTAKMRGMNDTDLIRLPVCWRVVECAKGGV